MRMLGARVHLQLLDLRATQTTLGQHAVHGATNRRLGATRQQLRVRLHANATRVAAVAGDLLVLGLATREDDLGCVDHDHMVAGVEARRERWLVLAAQQRGDLRAHATQHETVGVDDMPGALHIAGLCRKRTHVMNLSETL